MILPSKHVSQDRALLSVGARILLRLSRPKTVSALWEDMLPLAAGKGDVPLLHYDGFVLALDLLFLMGIIDLQSGLLRRRVT
ncbi:MAG: ABC-three component system middle component 6 [Candidatus Sulfotelmatobacter sp.]